MSCRKYVSSHPHSNYKSSESLSIRVTSHTWQRNAACRVAPHTCKCCEFSMHRCHAHDNNVKDLCTNVTHMILSVHKCHAQDRLNYLDMTCSYVWRNTIVFTKVWSVRWIKLSVHKCHTYDCIIESRHTYEWVMSHMQLSKGKAELRRVMSHIWIHHVTHMIESRQDI